MTTIKQLNQKIPVYYQVAIICDNSRCNVEVMNFTLKQYQELTTQQKNSLENLKMNCKEHEQSERKEKVQNV